MAKYEIMLILDPKANEAIASKLLNDVFGKNVEKVEKLERTELAYTIKKTQIAQYFLANVETEANTIREFTRKANIIKEVWRNLVINLDSERGLNRRVREKRPAQRKFSQGQYGDKFAKKPYFSRDQRDSREYRPRDNSESGQKREYRPRENFDPTQKREYRPRENFDPSQKREYRPRENSGDSGQKREYVKRNVDRPFDASLSKKIGEKTSQDKTVSNKPKID